MFPGFEHPFTCVIAGPTQSGKTVFVKNLLKGPHLYILNPPERIVWCYGVHSEKQINSIKQMASMPIEFIEGIPDLDMFSSHERTLLILDDLMADAGKSKQVASLFTRGCHHKNISAFLLLQNMFHRGNEMRDIHTSTNYVGLLENPRDYGQIEYLARQIFPQWKKYFYHCCMHAWRIPYNPIFLNLKQGVPVNQRAFSGVMPPTRFFRYEPINK